MARYIDADQFARKIKVSRAFSRAGADGRLLRSVALNLLNNVPTADVAPKSEVSILSVQIMALEKAKRDIQHEFNSYKGTRKILDDYNKKFITAAINQAKSEAIREVYETLLVKFPSSSFVNAPCTTHRNIFETLAGLREKYTEGNDG